MASIHWTMSFRNRLNQVVTVNIYDNAGGSGWPLHLKPAAVPFVTPGELGTPNVAMPEPALTSRLSLWPW